MIAPRSQLVIFDDTGERSLSIGQGDFVQDAVWSPDGRSIAFRRRALSLLPVDVPTELGVLSPDDGGDVPLFFDSAPTTDGIVTRARNGPSWSADGNELAFASQRESDHYRIWAVARSGGQLHLLLPELRLPHFHAAWSPRSSELAYVVEDAGGPDLWVTDLASGETRNLTRGLLAVIEFVRWSPDGERLSFSGIERAAVERDPRDLRDRLDIYVAELAGGELDRITSDAGSNVAAVWSPDAASLVVSSTRPPLPDGVLQNLNLWRVWLDGSREPEALTESRASTVATDWYPSTECGGDGEEE